MKYFYGILCILGVLLPYAAFVPWVAENGLNIIGLISEAGSARISAFAWLDVVVSACVLVGFILAEGSRQGMKRLWLPVLGTCTVGVSLGLPLFLLMREVHIENRSPSRSGSTDH